MSLCIAMVAGEASGDLLAAHLIAALKQHLPDARFVGIGGTKMEMQGFDAWWPAEKLSVRGYVEVLRHYREITGIRRDLLSRLLREKPDVFIGVDAPDFNLWLEQRLKARGIPAIHYVSPSVWAWRGGRIRKIARAVTHMLALFPFEPALYRKQEVPVTYVGHPLADVIPLVIEKKAARERLDIEGAAPVFALLPGSRQSELQAMAELFIETAQKLAGRFPDARFLVPLTTRETRNQFEEALWKCGAQEMLDNASPKLASFAAPRGGGDGALGQPGGAIKLMFGHAQDALAAADVALVASGTATLETALIKTPLVIAYRMSPWSWRLMRRMRYQPWVGLPNILAGRFVVPEFLQDDATADNLAQALGNLYADRQVREKLRQVFTEIHTTLRQNTSAKAAAAILPYLGRAAA
ncbi:MAG: lipid-A-disaccharide synthase [Gammaproteobacteria bacterium]|nr:lipid-A-disaccharide synthase [Gammaproteobacteria bacterium]MBU1647495.1 lipid-A-disaccharide synthase [Gammaproteobacteria bacterium]MBU1972944.1 lipid-A-disaccharide synthase [Gammaproteobacteria bacterium]